MSRFIISTFATTILHARRPRCQRPAAHPRHRIAKKARGRGTAAVTAQNAEETDAGATPGDVEEEDEPGRVGHQQQVWKQPDNVSVKPLTVLADTSVPTAASDVGNGKQREAGSSFVA
eukprot:1563977-Rhodomonas_salina.1